MDTLKFQITSRREFERLKATDPATLTDLERAGRFLYLQRTAFGGKVAGQNFGVDPRSAGGFNLTRLAPVQEEAHERLVGVVIENLDWLEVIDRYDRPETLFYLVRHTLAARATMAARSLAARNSSKWPTACGCSKAGSFSRSITCQRSAKPLRVTGSRRSICSIR